MTRPQSVEALRSRADDVAGLLKVLSHPTRLIIACELVGGERSVAALVEATGAPAPTLSRDLSRMRAAGLVKARRQSKSVYYRLGDARLGRLVAALCEAFSPRAKGTKRVRP